MGCTVDTPIILTSSLTTIHVLHRGLTDNRPVAYPREIHHRPHSTKQTQPKRSRPIDGGWQKERSAHALPGTCTPEFQLQRPPLLSEALTLLKSMSELSGYLFAKNLPAGGIRTPELPRASPRVWRRQFTVMPSFPSGERVRVEFQYQVCWGDLRPRVSGGEE